MAVVGLAQTLLDLTVEESLTKFGFRYVASEDWGRLHRLFRTGARDQARRRRTRHRRPARARARRRCAVRRPGSRLADGRGRRAAADRGAGERQRERAPPARALRPARLAALGDDGDPARRDPRRRVDRRHGRVRGALHRPARRDRDLGHCRLRRPAALPARDPSPARHRTAASCSRSSSSRASRRA